MYNLEHFNARIYVLYIQSNPLYTDNETANKSQQCAFPLNRELSQAGGGGGDVKTGLG